MNLHNELGFRVWILVHIGHGVSLQISQLLPHVLSIRVARDWMYSLVVLGRPLIVLLYYRHHRVGICQCLSLLVVGLLRLDAVFPHSALAFGPRCLLHKGLTVPLSFRVLLTCTGELVVLCIQALWLLRGLLFVFEQVGVKLCLLDRRSLDIFGLFTLFDAAFREHDINSELEHVLYHAR